MLILAFLATTLILIWLYLITPRLMSLGEDFMAHFYYRGKISFFNIETRTLNKPQFVEKTVCLKAENLEGNNLTLKRIESIVDPVDQHLLKQDEKKFNAHNLSRKFLADNKEGYFMFPQHTQKRNYFDIPYPLLFGYTDKINFSREEKLFGLPVYVFNYEIKEIDSTKFYENLGFPKTYTNQWGTIWVEPNSGFIVNHKDNWNSYVVDQMIKEGSYGIESGEFWFDDGVIYNLVVLAYHQKGTYYLLNTWIPCYLMLFIFAMIIGSLIKSKQTA